MFKLKWLVVLILFVIAVQPTFADDRAKLLGIWKLVSFEGEFQDTGERIDWEGKNPTGYIIFTPEGRMMAVIEGEERKVPQTDQDRVGLLRTMLAYTGMYRLEENKFITKVDVSWNPAWNGTDQVRFYKFDDNRLVISTSWGPSQRYTGRVSRALLNWERVK
jgi:hypothetical protein